MVNNDNLKYYFKDLRKIEVISGEKQVKLAIKAKNGDRKALEELVKTNLKFVVKIAKTYEYSGFPLEDLINEGNIGLIKSIERFDESKETKFISYAVWWIRQSIMQFIYDNGNVVRIPINRININNKVNKAKDKLFQKLNREPTACELSEEVELCEKDVKISLEKKCFVELDSPIDGESDCVFGDMIEGDGYEEINRGMNRTDCRTVIDSVLSTLDERESKVLKMYFGMDGDHGMTLQEIGEKMNLTNERVRQIKEFALKKLRTYNKSSRLREFLKYKL